MLDYEITETNRNSTGALKLLVTGSGFPAGMLADYRLAQTDAVDSAGLAQSIERVRPDILLMEGRLAGREIAALMQRAEYADLPVVARIADADADNIGLLLDCQLEFIAPNANDNAIADAVHQAARRLHLHAADRGSHFDGMDRIEQLKRDAERVATMVAELMSTRPEETTRPITAARIRSRIKARRLRERFFPADLLADPAWDMLLDLSAARLEQRPVSVSSLCIAASVPTTTALRWIKRLCDDGMFLRSADPGDARRAFISLSPQTAQLMDACLEAVLNQPGQ